VNDLLSITSGIERALRPKLPRPPVFFGLGLEHVAEQPAMVLRLGLGSLELLCREPRNVSEEST